jgi:hypothetical protein
MNAGLSCESWIGIRQSLMQGTNRLALIRWNFWPYSVPAHSARCDQEFSDCSTTPRLSMEKLITPRSVTHFSRRRFLLAGAAVGASLPFADREAEAAGADLPEPRRHLGGMVKQKTAMNFFPGFSAESVKTSGTTIHVLRKGTGRPLLLLHGLP